MAGIWPCSSWKNSLSPSQQSAIVFVVISSVAILLAWDMPYVSILLYPFKILTVALHELSHATAVVFTGGRVVEIHVNANEGGYTSYVGGVSSIILPAGYLGSSIIGSFLVFCGFSPKGTLAAAFALELALLITLYWITNAFGIIYCLFFVVGIALVWWKMGVNSLRYVVLFIGTMSALYSIFDIIGDLISHRIQGSDAYQYSQLYTHGLVPPEVFGIIWFIISMLILSSFIALALYVFKPLEYEPMGGDDRAVVVNNSNDIPLNNFQRNPYAYQSSSTSLHIGAHADTCDNNEWPELRDEQKVYLESRYGKIEDDGKGSLI